MCWDDRHVLPGLGELFSFNFKLKSCSVPALVHILDTLPYFSDCLSERTGSTQLIKSGAGVESLDEVGDNSRGLEGV